MAPRVEERTELKCRLCEKIVPTEQYSYSQKKKKYRRRCPPCVAYALYLRGEGPKPAGADTATRPVEYGRIQLTEQLLPPQKLSGVTHLKTIVVEPTTSGPGQRRARSEKSKNAGTDLPVTYQSTSSSSSAAQKKAVPRKSRAERDVVEELLDEPTSSSSKFKVPKNKQSKNKQSSAKPTHQRQLSNSEQARILYQRQLSGRRKIRASRDFDNEEEAPELLKGEKGRKRLSVLDGGYPRESMKPGPERVVGA